ncbi:putative Proline iminopeptidase (PIP) (Prolyl aminopeptidase) (PAP) (Tricorn protease-interacting factor F1) [Bradyrhizobium sp. STM 3843]|uniref:proline iminopeptidase-family hydrolase n=1 Tax=Bradyrhizobium sp. STM 3843 TaxID=551947 RepID=UPI0002404074|nr:proline iminopeptidase-family hydrolase [Bradyrhizobium sp. STM 3843]CCE10387.1 putative Proline iminopeptidase (PIP) (Prolyl aminopeptidase) (PAP) (Tricorn protease-interacting factor F1) [Bradyrhizobium sp. STM 3843]
MTITRREILLGAAALPTAAALAATTVAGAREGTTQTPHGRIWWKIAGAGPRTPLLLLHGGPGAGHNYLEPLSAIADQRPVIFYDQLGCGRSDKPDSAALWTVDHFVQEIDLLRADLGLDRVILYGHSWGGWLAQEYLAQRGDQAKVEALVLAGTSASTRQFVAGALQLLSQMPGGLDARRRELEAAGKTDTFEYQEIVQAFLDAHVYHDNWPSRHFAKTIENISTSRTYAAMNGPNEFSVTGTLRDWDRESSLAAIDVPTLVLTGEMDEVTLDCHLTLQRGIRNAHLVVMPKARHLAMLEQPESYNWILRGFLSNKA